MFTIFCKPWCYEANLPGIVPMPLSNANAQQATLHAPNEYCTELFAKIAFQNNLQNTHQKASKKFEHDPTNLNNKVISPVCNKIQNLKNPSVTDTEYASRLKKKTIKQREAKPWWEQEIWSALRTLPPGKYLEQIG